MTHCPNCGARIVPTPREMRKWRKAAGLNLHEMARRLEVTASYFLFGEGNTITRRHRDRTLPEIHFAMNLRHAAALALLSWTMTFTVPGNKSDPDTSWQYRTVEK
jgi:transcriptional regulator with XRE-family HTH domain